MTEPRAAEVTFCKHGVAVGFGCSGCTSDADIQVRQTVTHGVECHEAWRENTDCPHEKTEETPSRGAFVKETPPRAPADRPSWAICGRCQIGDHDGCTMPETNEECCCGA